MKIEFSKAFIKASKRLSGNSTLPPNLLQLHKVIFSKRATRLHHPKSSLNKKGRGSRSPVDLLFLILHPPEEMIPRITRIRIWIHQGKSSYIIHSTINLY